MTEGAVYTFLIRGPRRQARLRLQGSFFVIGRTEGFPVFQDDPSISREHCAVVATDAGVVVKDLGSSNGVVLNGERLDRYAELPLREGDELIVGRTTLQLVGEADEVEGDQVTVDRDGRSRVIAPAQALDDPEDVPGEDPEARDVAPDDDPGSSDPEGLADAPTEDDESAVSDTGLAEDLEALHAAAGPDGDEAAPDEGDEGDPAREGSAPPDEAAPDEAAPDEAAPDEASESDEPRDLLLE